MNWTPEALTIVHDLQTNNREFIEAACEYVAQLENAPEVTTEHVATTLAWMVSVSVDIEKEKETP